jgi:hypothetical protein
MDTFQILMAIDAELARLEQVRVLLTENTTAPKQGKKSGKSTRPKRRTMSAEGKARIAAAQKARWAKAKASRG